MRIYWSDMKTLAVNVEHHSDMRTTAQMISTIRYFVRTKKKYSRDRYERLSTYDFSQNGDFLKIIFAERKKPVLRFITPDTVIYDPKILASAFTQNCSWHYSERNVIQDIENIVYGTIPRIKAVPIVGFKENTAEIEFLKSISAIS